jgi:hypothetical protein
VTLAIAVTACEDSHRPREVPQPASEADPLPEPAPSREGNVVTYPATTLGLDAFSANGRIQPHGAPTDYWFEYGPTTDYGWKTPVKAVAPKLAAFHRESWDAGTGGWRGGSGEDLKWVPNGGLSGGYVHYQEPTGVDYNHADGIGLLHLVQYLNLGIFEDERTPTAALGGKDPDLRDARVRVAVRGTSWNANGTELLWWSQIDVTHGKPPPDRNPAYSNWANTGFVLTDALFSGSWERVEYRLWNDTTQWTYAGTNRELNKQLDRSVYVYAPLDEVLSHLDIDVFHLLAFVDPYHSPTGAIDFDELEIAYRNRSVVFPPNGGKVASAPVGSTDPATLTDGWRNGDGKTWKSAPFPTEPFEIVYELAQPVLVERVQLHQNPEWPSKNVEVLVTADGEKWETIATGALPPSSPAGPSFAYFLAIDLDRVFDTPSRKVKIRVLDGYKPGFWGLGEIEVFGRGAVMATDDDWYRVNADVTGLARGQTYHYRLVTKQGDKLELGGDLTFTVPETAKPDALTGAATRIGGSSAKVEARINSLGVEAQTYFEYGDDIAYGRRTPPRRAGPEVTPRTVAERLEGLSPGRTVHYRIVVESPFGTTYGRDASFVAR